MKIELDKKLDATDIIVLILILFSAFLILFTSLRYLKFSPEFVNHTEFGASLLTLGVATFAGFFSFWLKLTDMAKDIGEIKGTLNQFIKNHSKK